jgi:alpha-amylase/alpha-mannosidase (GH57 family)
MTTPLKILFLWHHHQPYYKTDGVFLLPWVRMHGIKDYWDMVRILDDYPKIKQVFNFTPSLLIQLEEYIENGTTDFSYALSAKNPEQFTEQEKIDALKTFFLSNSERMIKRYPRYAELKEKRGMAASNDNLREIAQRFTAQDFRDLQVWWNLAWVGEYSRFDPPFKYYIDKQRDFSEDEKSRLLKAHTEILKRIVPHHVRALERGQIEVSVSPFYHPILPLLCDTTTGKIADPKITLPKHNFKSPEDATHQVKSGLELGEKMFGMRPNGMWPSEGSVSADTLEILIKNKVKWTATDEAVLRKTLNKTVKTRKPKQETTLFIEKYFAYNFKKRENTIKIFFRDHELSDLIGFVYSQWNPDDAARDFILKLHKIREAIVTKLGAGMLDYAVVPIILDGENAWEFYQSDGKDFLRTLYYLISNDQQIETVLPSEVRVMPEMSLRDIEPGSWINGNFNIWIGNEENNKAWDLLYKARLVFEEKHRTLPATLVEKAYTEILIAEGSDWWWWYSNEHNSSQTEEFDKLFRFHLAQVYSLLDEKPPDDLEKPIKKIIGHMFAPDTITSMHRNDA